MSRELHDDETRLVPAGTPGSEDAFPIVLRGYDRQSVDAQIADLRRQLDELAAVRSPEVAVQRALDRVGVETAGILREAHRTAEELTTASRIQAEELTVSSRAQADDRLEHAEREAVARRAEAEARVVQLDRDADLIWQERQRLIDDTRRLADSLLRVADDAAERFPAEELPAEEPALDEPLAAEAPPEEPLAAEAPPEGPLAAEPPPDEPAVVEPLAAAVPPEKPSGGASESVDQELARAEEHPQATVSMDRAELEKAMTEPDPADATTERRGGAA